MTTSDSEPDEELQHHTEQELRSALGALTQAAFSRLEKQAEYWWKKRKLREPHGEPSDLLNQTAVQCLNPRGKRWKRGVSLEKHLSQAMRSISGHWARQGLLHSGRTRAMDEIPDLEQTRPGPSSDPEQKVLGREQLDILRQHFGPDQEAFEFLIRKAVSSERETAKEMGLTKTRQTAVARRARRKLTQFVERGELPI